MADRNLSPPKSWNSNENILSVHPREVVMAGGGGGSSHVCFYYRPVTAVLAWTKAGQT